MEALKEDNLYSNMAAARSVVEIDGGVLEGGGQILRNSVTFACLLKRAIRVCKIRAGRDKPGLRPQHKTGLDLIGDLCKGTFEGASDSSDSITFHPGNLLAGSFVADTHTAGSTSLLLQVALPCLIYAPAESTMVLKGGTNCEMAPQIDYMTQVFQPVAKKFGLDFEIDVRKRGYFPKGGGEVDVKVRPVSQLKAVTMVDRGSVRRIWGQAFVAGVLPIKIAQRMADEATRLLLENHDIPVDIETVKEPAHQAVGTGTGLWIVVETSTGCRLAGSSVGRKGVPAEQVANDAVEELKIGLKNNCCVDEHLQDQVIVLMALAEGKSSFKTGPVTLHTKTAIHIAEKMTKAKFTINPFPEEEKTDGEAFIIECNGIGLKNKYL